jgi:DNA-binding NtrC family response regulator
MNSSPSVITIVKSEKLDRQLRRNATRLDFHLHSAPHLKDLIERLDVEMFDIIVISSAKTIEYDADHIEDMLNLLCRKAPHSQILLLTEPDDVEMIGMTFTLESVHFVKLPVTDEEVRVLLENAYSRIEDLTIEHDFSGDDRMGQIVGGSHAMQSVYRQIGRAAGTDISVMLMGETGTGKDLVAQAIHRLGARKDESYVPVNLGALPTELIASELFGHEKGAFTGATKMHRGKFEQAKKGTLFLDEIESIDAKVQISLLRILEEKRFTRLGGVDPIRSNTRLIVATNEDLRELVARGRFRKDLYYRLDVFCIELPPLRKRYGDIPLLISEFIAKFSFEFGSSVTGVSSEVLQCLEAYDWPGNVRELKNTMQRAILMCDGDTIKLQHLPDRLIPQAANKPTVEFDIGTSLDEVERTMILRALELSENNRKKAADLLGISRRAIYNKLKKHDIE